MGVQLRGAIRSRLHMAIPLVIAAILRVPGAFNGLPYVRHPDEPINYQLFHYMVREGRLTPGFYDYPSLSYDLQATVHVIFGGMRWLAGRPSAVAGMDPVPGWLGGMVVRNETSWILARLVVVVVSLVGVAVVANTAALLCRSKKWGAVAGTFAAVSSIGVATGFVITPDALAGTTAMVFLAALVRWHLATDDEHSGRRIVVLGVLLGLAAGAKYNNGLLVGAFALTVVLLPQARRPTVRQLGVFAATAAATFVVTTPAAILHPATFIDALRGVADHYSGGHAGAEGDTLATNLRFLRESEPVAAIGALLAVAFVRRRTTWILAGWTVGYFAILSLPEVRWERNLTPIIGTVAVLGALGWQRAWSVLSAAVRERRQRVDTRLAAMAIAAVACAPIAIWQTVRTVDELDHQLTDYQEQARVWLDAQLEPGESVLLERYAPWLDRARYDITSTGYVVAASPDVLASNSALVINSWGAGIVERDPSRYPDDVVLLAQLRAEACDVRRFEDDWGFWIEVIDRHCDVT